MNGGEPAPSGERALESAPGRQIVLRRHRPERFTPRFKLAGLGMMFVTWPLIALPLLVLAALGCLSGPPQIVSGTCVGLLWALSLADSGVLLRNQSLRRAALEDYRRQLPSGGSLLGFVGLSTAGYLRSAACAADTHEDVGLLVATDGALEFHGDSLSITVPRRLVNEVVVRWDPNCSWVGLHWIRIACSERGDVCYLYVQSRDKDRLTCLPASNDVLLARLQRWVKAGLHGEAYTGD